jgi:hypothetical protein
MSEESWQSAADAATTAEFERLSGVVREAVLRPALYPDQECRLCTYFIDEPAPLAFCWHERIQTLVHPTWWCQWWEESDG